MTVRTLFYTLTAVFCVVIALAAWVVHKADMETVKTVPLEIFRSLLQLAVIVLLGGVIAALVKAAEDTRRREADAQDRRRQHEVEAKEREDHRATLEKAEELRQAGLRAEILEEYLKSLGLLYRSVKSSRRELRAAGMTSKYRAAPQALSPCQCQELRQQMKNLNSAQLDLEGMMIESERLPVFMGLRDLTQYLRSMEDYLRGILSEYEKWYPRMAAKQEVAFDHLPLLREFTGSTRDGFQSRRFLKEFGEPYENILNNISESIRDNPANRSTKRS